MKCRSPPVATILLPILDHLHSLTVLRRVDVNHPVWVDRSHNLREAGGEGVVGAARELGVAARKAGG